MSSYAARLRHWFVAVGGSMRRFVGACVMRTGISICEDVFRFFGLVSALAVVLVLCSVVISVLLESALSFGTFGFGFISSGVWNEVQGQFGALNAIYGTVLGALITMSISVPFSFGIAVCLSLVASKRMRTLVGICIELLAAVPSIVYGMVGLLFLVPLLASLSDSYGMGIFSAAIVLSVMVLPFMTVLMRDSIESTSDVLRESAYALGMTTFEVVKDVLLPCARTGIIGSVILSLSRVLGETMAVTFLIGGSQRIPHSLFEPATNIPSTIAINFGEADSPLYSSSLFYLALILLLINIMSISAAKYFMRNQARK